jgi:hypothetical protein
MTLSTSRLTRYGFGLLCGLILLMSGQAAMAEGGTITGVRVAPDLSNVAIRFNGQIGRHATFVMGSPYRLVLDLEDTGLSKIPSRMAVSKDPIREIRLGQSSSRARLVVDFGDNPVPPFRIERGNNQVSIAFGNRLYQGLEPFDRPAANSSAKAPAAKRPSMDSRVPKAPVCPVTVKSTDVRDHVVFVDLADSRDPQRCYRLQLDMDFVDMKVRRATLDTGDGKAKETREEEIVSRPLDREEPARRSSVEQRSGSRNNPAVESKSPKSKFKWGVPASGGAGPESSGRRGKGSFRIEGFTMPKPAAASEAAVSEEWDVMPNRDE